MPILRRMLIRLNFDGTRSNYDVVRPRRERNQPTADEIERDKERLMHMILHASSRTNSLPPLERLLPHPPTPPPPSTSSGEADTSSTSTGSVQRGSQFIHGILVTAQTPLRDRMTIVAGSEDDQEGIRAFTVSRPHINSLSNEFIAVLRRRRRHAYSRQRPWEKEHVLPEDNATAIAIILFIAHLKFQALPERLPLRALLNLADVAERYNLNHLLMGTLNNWLEPHREKITRPHYHAFWMRVAWQFGLEEDYLQVAQHLALHCGVDRNGNLMVPESRPEDRKRVKFVQSSRVVFEYEVITRARQHVLNALLTALYDLLEESSTSISCQVADPASPEALCCSARNTLVLRRFLTEHSLYPKLADARSIRVSVQQFVQMLKEADLSEEVPMPMVMSRQRTGLPQTLPSPSHFRLHSSHEAGCSMAPYLKAVAKDTMRDVQSLAGVTTPLIVWQMRVNGARRRGRDHS